MDKICFVALAKLESAAVKQSEITMPGGVSGEFGCQKQLAWTSLTRDLWERMLLQDSLPKLGLTGCSQGKKGTSYRTVQWKSSCSESCFYGWATSALCCWRRHLGWPKLNGGHLRREQVQSCLWPGGQMWEGMATDAKSTAWCERRVFVRLWSDSTGRVTGLPVFRGGDRLCACVLACTCKAGLLQ